ncbi:MAG TPA: WYL domain-containing protein [Myxococcales bacterium]|jgi:proteasome accessory factor B|nr:WYL domain-containing protein [Myxococcales bacterium]
MNPEPAKRPPEERLLRLAAWLLLQRTPVTFADIRVQFPADYGGSFEACDKRWTRDKQSLQEAGVPIQFVAGDSERPEGYLVDPHGYYLSSLKLSPEELAVLWTAGQAAVRMGGYPWRGELVSALRKLQVVAGAPDSPRRPLPQVNHGAAAREQSRWMEQIGVAVRQRKRVSLRYYVPARDEQTEREVDVYGLAWRRGVWLFAGHCHLRQGIRVFYLTRLRALKVNAKEPSKPDYEIPADFNVRAYSAQQPWDYWIHAEQEACVRLRGGLAGLASSLLPGARIEEQSPDSVLARLTVRDLDALVRYALSLGPEAEIVAPEQGRERARQMLGRLQTSVEGGAR